MARRRDAEFHAPASAFKRTQVRGREPQLRVRLPHTKPITLRRGLPELKVDLPRRAPVEIRDPHDPVADLLRRPAHRHVVPPPLATIESVEIVVEDARVEEADGPSA